MLKMMRATMIKADDSLNPPAVPVENQTAGVAPRLGRRLAILSMLMLVAGLLVALLAWLAGTNTTLVLIAWLTCFAATLGAHLAAEYPAGDEYILLRMISGSLVRTGLPLVVSVWALYIAVPPIEKKLVLFMILFYLTGLVADSWMSLARLKSAA